MKHFSTLSSILTFSHFLAAPGPTKDAGVWPIALSPNASVVAPGSSVTFTVTVNQSGGSSTLLSLSNNNSSAFSTFPTSVTIANGQTQVTFQATTSSSYNGTVTVTAEANSHSAQANLNINRD